MGQLTKVEILFMGFMLFSMLFGAGNLIFPAYLGQAAGEHVWQAVFGFIISDAGLAVIGFIAIAKAKSFQVLVNRVHPVFAFLFPIAIYLAIGPGLAIPRAGSLAFEMGVKPFLPVEWAVQPWALFSYTVVFFAIVFWFAKSPSKLIDLFGKVLTPALLLLILIVFAKSLFTDLPGFQAASLSYQHHPISQGFLDGYQTMDGLCALIYGIVFTNIFVSKNVTNPNLQIKYLTLFGLICAALLAICYLIIAYLGAQTSLPENVDNGAVVLSTVLHQLFGPSGTVVLGLIFTLACLSVCIGLITSCSQYFSSIFPRWTYLQWMIMLCIVSGLVANFGLSQILQVSIPVLGVVYPIAMTLMALALLHDYLPYRHRPVYVTTISLVGIFSVLEMVNSTFLHGAYSSVLGIVPLQANGFGWVVPGMLGLVIGSILEKWTTPTNPTVNKVA